VPTESGDGLRRANPYNFCRSGCASAPWLFQKQIHAVKIDDGIAFIERVHSKNPADRRIALP
jgi:hypothetical protein